MNTQQGRRRAGGNLVRWAIEIVILVAALVAIGFLEGLPALQAIFTQQGGFFIRLFVLVIWGLASFYYNDSRSRA